MQAMWDIFLDSWVTMDWGYNDVACGEIIESPLYFSSDGMVPTEETQKRVERKQNDSRRYHVMAEVTAVWDYKWEIDFGLRAISANPVPAGVTRGSYVTGEVELGIDYPPTDLLGYRWSIEAITKETAPRIPVDDKEFMRRHPKHRISDLARATYTNVERTDGYSDSLLEETHIRYILYCQRMDSGNASDRAKSVMHRP